MIPPLHKFIQEVKPLAEILLSQEKSLKAPAIIALAEKHRLLPWLYYHGWKDHPLALKTYQHSLIHYALAKGILENLHQQVDQSSIPIILIKGVAVAHQFYPHPALRPFGDVDVLIPESCLSQVTQRLIQTRFCLQPPDPYGPFSHILAHSKAWKTPGKISGILDIHHRLIDLPHHHAIEKLMDFTETLNFSDMAYLVLQKEAHWVYLAIHWLADHAYAPQLLWLWDLYLPLTNQQVEWGKIKYLTHLTHTEPWIKLTLQVLRQIFPPETLPKDDLKGKTLSPSMLRWANHNHFRVLRKIQRLPFFKKLHLLGYLLFPSRAYMRFRFGSSLPIGWTYPLRLVQSLFKLLKMG